MSWKSQWEGARDRSRGNADMFFQLKHVAPEKRTPPGPLPSTTYSHSGFVQLMWLDLVLLFFFYLCTKYLYQPCSPHFLAYCKPRDLSSSGMVSNSTPKLLCSQHTSDHMLVSLSKLLLSWKELFFKGQVKFKLLKFLFCFATGRWECTTDAYRQSYTFLVLQIFL